MKKAVVLIGIISLLNAKSFSQNIVIPKRSVTKDISKNYINTNDSTLSKTGNGFDVKKSKIDNMVYLNVNENNPSLSKMPIAINRFPVEPMPVANTVKRAELFLKDTIIFVNMTDTLKRVRKN